MGPNEFLRKILFKMCGVLGMVKKTINKFNRIELYIIIRIILEPYTPKLHMSIFSIDFLLADVKYLLV